MIAEVAPCRRMPAALAILDYHVPDHVTHLIHIGSLVSIPLGNRSTYGVVIALRSESNVPAKNLKSITDCLSKSPALPEKQLFFISEIAQRYRASLGALLTTNLFPANKKSYAIFSRLKFTSIDSPETNSETSSLPTYYCYSSRTERSALLFKHSTERSTGQHLVIVPTIDDAIALHTEYSNHKIPTVLCTSETATPQLRTLWFSIRSNTPCIVIGTRRALFLPWTSLTSVLIDSEGDRNFEQFDTAPRTNVRELALLLAHCHRASALVSGHTPSLIGYEILRSSNQQPLTLQSTTALIHVDISKERQIGLSGLISLPLEEHIRSISGHIFLYLNQRGHAQCVMCKDCRHTYRCPTCATALTFHASHQRLVCHICGHEQRLGACPSCRGLTVQRYGYGTGALEETVKKYFPDRTCIRIDSDQNTSRLSWDRDTIFVGTDMAWRFIPWETISLMAYIDAASNRYVPEWNSSEQSWYRIRDSLFRLSPNTPVIFQAAGDFEHGVIPKLHNPEAWYEGERSERRAVRYPPFSTIIKISFEHPEEHMVRQMAEHVYHSLRELTKNVDFYTIHPPAALHPALLHRHYRQAILVKIHQSNPDSTTIRRITQAVPASSKIAINPPHLLT